LAADIVSGEIVLCDLRLPGIDAALAVVPASKVRDQRGGEGISFQFSS